MPLSPDLAARLAETSSWDDLTESEQDELTMAWLEDDGRLDPDQESIPIEDCPELNEDEGEAAQNEDRDASRGHSGS